MGGGGRGSNRWVVMGVVVMVRDCVNGIGVGGWWECTGSILVKTAMVASGVAASNGISAGRDEAARGCGCVV